jgi:hypothetical protein
MNRKCSAFVIVVLMAAVGATMFAQMQGSKSEEKGKSDGTEQKLSQMEKDLWEAWKNHDVEPFKKAMAAQSVNVSSGGVAGTEQALKNLGSSDCKVKGYSLADTNFTWLDKNTVLMTYKADQDATCNGQKIPGTVWASSVWVNKDKQWKAAFHQETPAQSAAEKKAE